MNIYILISFCVLLILIAMVISIDIKLNFNILNNIGSLKIKIFKVITIMNSNIVIIDDYLSVSNKKSKVIKIKLDINDINIQFINELNTYIKQKIYTTYISSDIQISLDNQMVSALLSSVINIFLTFFYYNFKINNKDTTIHSNVLTGFRHNLIEFTFNLKFKITIFDLLWALIKASIVVRRDNEEENAKAANT